MFTLICSDGHRFEAWFASGAAFEDQAGRGLVGCPHCGDTVVRKAPMAPAVAGTRKREGGSDVPPALVSNDDVKLRALMGELRARLTENSEDVGRRFAAVARAIHFGEDAPRTVHGEASGEEVRALVEDGVPVAPLPPDPGRAN